MSYLSRQRHRIKKRSFTRGVKSTLSSETGELTLKSSSGTGISKLQVNGLLYQTRNMGTNLAPRQTGVRSYGDLLTNTVLRPTSEAVISSLIEVEGNTKYFLSKEIADGNSSWRWFWYEEKPVYNTTRSIDGMWQSIGKVACITSPENAKYLFVAWTLDNDDYPCGKVWINKGAVQLPYEEYTEGKYTPIPEIPEVIRGVSSISLNDKIYEIEPLYGIDDCCDSLVVDKTNRTVKINRQICQYTLTGSEEITDISIEEDNAFRVSICSSSIPEHIENKRYYCSHFSNEYMGEKAPFFNLFYNRGATICEIYYVNQRGIEEFKAWLYEQFDNGTPVTIMLATSDFFQTDHAYEEWARALLDFKSDYGSDIVISTNEAASKIEASYYTIEE